VDVEQPRVTVYTLSSCGHCLRALSLLERRGIPYAEIRGDRISDFRRKLRELTGSASVPQITILGEPIGGADALARLDRRGLLVARVRGEQFPRAIVRRRLSLGDAVIWLLAPLLGATCAPWRYGVELVERDGSVIDRRRCSSEPEAHKLAAALNEAEGAAGEIVSSPAP
jgi:glutaredoxin 3